MSYTFQKVAWEHSTSNDAGSIMNAYGDIHRQEPVNITARKQPHEEVINNTDGSEILTKSIYYVDPSIEKHAKDIAYMDKLDGETVVKIYNMCTLSGKVRMIRFITV